ncbi:MAG: hypothetical protein ACYTE8_01980 [Planctomycetota bacterium]|jgi:hypothetical protein
MLIRGFELICCLALVFSLTACSSVDHYKTNQDCVSLWNILYTQVNQGDSIERIEALLGVGMLQTGQRKTQILAANKRLIKKNPDGFPDGIEDTDEFIGYFCYGATLYLQFRDRKLINYTRDDYKKFQRRIPRTPG